MQGRITFVVNIHNLNSNMSLREFVEKLHEKVDVVVRDHVEEHTKDQEWIYDIAAYLTDDKGKVALPPIGVEETDDGLV